MAEQRDNPYGAFNYQVDIGVDPTNIVGGFSDVSGLGFEVQYAEYRNGNEPIATARKVPNTHKQDDVTLKRGVLGSTNVFEWLKGVRDGLADPRQVTITLLDETGTKPVSTWRLRNAQPKKWTGPTLAAKGGTEVAMEELQLVHEGIEFE
jgi:phage tail-like protein